MNDLVYYNEFDLKAAAWIRQLQANVIISNGPVDTRSIVDVKPEEVSKFLRCHFFSGISGWQYALQLAGWPKNRLVWSGSCPCQSYSNAGKKRGNDDERNLWPIFFDLIRKCHPPTIFGEQVASAIRFGWIDRVQADLEGEGYAFGFAVLGAHSVGSPHIRQRLFWVANLPSNRWGQGSSHIGRCDSRIREKGDRVGSANDGFSGGMGESDRTGSFEGRIATATNGQRCPIDSASGGIDRLVDPTSVGHGGRCENGDSQSTEVLGSGHEFRPDPSTVGVGNPDSAGSQGLWPSVCGKSGRRQGDAFQASDFRFWDRDWRILDCRDGKKRRTQSSIFPLADGLPKRMVYSRDPVEPFDANDTQEARVMRLRGYGNAIVPQVAASFIRAFMETEESE